MPVRSAPTPSKFSTLFEQILRLSLVNDHLLSARAQTSAPPSSLSSAQQEVFTSPKLTTGATVAITVGVAMFFIVVAILVSLVIRRRRHQRRKYAIMPESGGTLNPSPLLTKNLHSTHHSPFHANATGGIAALRPVLLLGSNMTGILL
ncbi:hypothetical protein EYR36_009148 [Pleurotus pulmonarius]|nr:hypothetical protein EYR36_009148 [Pleurotus pulmonarius]KAF4592643.1 hypothetical protein EYR38_008342 [Pleurotus pulmonarius]